MMPRAAAFSAAWAFVALAATGLSPEPLAAQGAVGTISGHIRLSGPAPANPLIRMGADPRCSRATRGQRITQDVVLTGAGGGLANGFLHLQGTFPATPVSPDPVTIDQRNCLFAPRVAAVRVGQTLQITNSDPTAHNLHSASQVNAFNTSQPKQGMVYKVQLKTGEVMMRIRCDIHTWMTTYVGVTTHSYVAVSGTDGAFTIARVPAGRHTIAVWHEAYGVLTRTVEVKAGATATVDFAYTGKEKPGSAALEELVIPEGPASIQLLAAR
jgi:plastocyanin